MKTFNLNHLPSSVARVLRVFHRLQRLYALLGLACVTLSLYLLLALVAMHLDRLLFLTPATRGWLSLGVHLLPALYALVALALFIRRAPSVRRVAYDLGSRLPQGDGERYATLDSVLQRALAAPADGVHAELLAQLQHATEDLSRDLRPARLVRDARLPRRAAVLVLLLAGLAALALLPGYELPLMVRRLLAPQANLPKPSFVHLQVTPASPVLGRGEEVVLQVAVTGDIPLALAWLYRLAGVAPSRCLMVTAPGRVADLPMHLAAAHELNRVQRRLFVYSQSDLTDTFSYRLRCGDAETAVQVVEVVAQPRITGLKLLVQPPAYTHRPPVEISDPHQPVPLFAGSQVELQVTVDQAVTEHTLLLGGQPGPALTWDEATHRGTYRFTMKDKQDLEVRVRNARGFANVERARVSLLRLEDRPPTVQLDYPAGDLTVVPGELLPVQALAEDDLEVASATFRYRLNPTTNPDAPPQDLPLTLAEPHSAHVALAENFDLAQTGAGPGDELVFTVRVRDSAGNDGESRPVQLRVTAFTRGENERRRLAALGLVRELLDGIKEAPAAAAPELDRTRYATARQHAAAQGLALDESASFAGFVRWLELEQHFTDAPRHKEDARALIGVLDAAWALGGLPGATGAAATAPWPRTLNTEVVTPLWRARQVQNVVWRLFGMQAELDDIQRHLSEAEATDAQQGTARQQTLVAFILSLAETAATRAEVQAAAKQEQDLRQQLTAVKARAKAVTPPPAATTPNDPFAPLQVDVDTAKLSPADEQLAAQLKKQIAAATAARGTSMGAAAAQVAADPAVVAKGTAASIAAKDLPGLVTAVFGRVWHTDASGTADGATAAGRQSLASELAAARGRAPAGAAAPAHPALARRTELYLKALEDLGVDLAAAADGSSALDAAALKALQGELNTAAYYLTHGNGARQRESCDQVAARLQHLLTTVRPALPPLLREEQQARVRLQAYYTAAWARVAAGLPLAADAPRRLPLAFAWAERDLAMLERNPFAPLTSRLRDLALLDALDQPLLGAAELTALTDFLAPTGALVAAVPDDRRANALRAYDWELSELRATPRVGTVELALAGAVVAYSAALADDLAADIGTPSDAHLLSLPLTATAPATATPIILVSGAPADLLRTSLQRVSAPSAEQALLHAARARLPIGQVRTVAAGALEQTTAATTALAALATALAHGEAGQQGSTATASAAEQAAAAALARELARGEADLPALIASTVARVHRAVRRTQQVVRLAALDVGYDDPLANMRLSVMDPPIADPLAGDARQEERLLLRLREALDRFHGRAGPALDTLAAAQGHELDAAQLGAIGADLTQLQAGVQALQHTLAGALADYTAPETGSSYPLLATFAETRAWVIVSHELAGRQPPAAVAARFVQESAAARLEYLSVRSADLAAAQRAVQGASRALEATPPQIAAAGQQLSQAQALLSAWQGALTQAGKGPFEARCQEDTAALLARLKPLLAPDAVAEAAAQRRTLLALGELEKDAQRLLRRVQAEAATGGGLALEYAGGPDGIWLQATRLDAEVARQRLLSQVRHARRRFILGVLAGFTAPPTTNEVCEVQAWALVVHRLPRSPLSGAVTPPRGEAGGAAARNPLLKWLLGQLDEAAGQSRSEDSLRNYPAVSRELIQSTKDFLRY